MTRLRDWRIWFGLIVTAVCLWLALRDVSFGAVARDLRSANLVLLIGLGVPANVYMLYVRALRWRHLTDAIQPIERGPLFRATAVGFMANNLFPLRVGEVVRAWYLARDTGTSGAAVLGTVLLERVIDSLFFLVMAIGMLVWFGSQATGLETGRVVPPLLLISVVPLIFIVALRVAPDRIVALTRVLARPLLPEGVAFRIEGLVQRFSEGLGSLRGGTHLFWIAFHSLFLWLGVALVPFLVGIWALDVDLGSPGRAVVASYVMLVMVGLFVAVPSAPGFFGPYHYACRLAL